MVVSYFNNSFLSGILQQSKNAIVKELGIDESCSTYLSS